ncbi:MAG: DHH family phosphoesterase [Lachnospiraceae bacterium]|nr:DHH family phosphoesterase [Lachnospiraceae bacterium]
MQLKDLEIYNPITIQCHDNPDGDALASGYGLYCYFRDQGKDTRFVYSGRNQIQKTNLTLMVEKLNIPIEYVKPPVDFQKGLLITVDCQYGAGNVTGIPAEHIAIIDHHQIEIEDIALSRIDPSLGSCATLVWKMLREEGYRIGDNVQLGTALYYGLYSDTNQFAEIYNPHDMDMRDSLVYQKSLITIFRNSNLSLKELEIAGIAMIRYIFNDDYNYAIIHSQPCDPNILGLISDLLIQVDEVRTCVVYNEVQEGYKLSIRSCVKEVQASELANFLCAEVGSGGGHLEKAGGFISKGLYEEYYPTLHSEAYFSQKMNEYFDLCDIIYAREYETNLEEMQLYRSSHLPVGYVHSTDILPAGTPVTIRTLEGDTELTVDPDMYIMVGVKGEVYTISREKFENSYRVLPQKFCAEECILRAKYRPTVKNKLNGEIKLLLEHAGVCEAIDEEFVYARRLDRRVKVFTLRDEEKYMLGRPGDYLIVRGDDRKDVSVVEADVFAKMFQPA